VDDAGFDGSLHWTYAYDGAQPDGYARWTIHVEEPGEYEIFVFITPEFAESTMARYHLRAGEEEREIRLDQSAADGWTSLGSYYFAGDSAEWLAIYDNTGEPFAERLRFVADALRLGPLGGIDEADQEASDAGGLADIGHHGTNLSTDSRYQSASTSSCSAARHPASPAAALLFLLFGLFVSSRGSGRRLR
jgi:hypothetical protein